MARYISIVLLFFFVSPSYSGDEIYYRDLRHYYDYDKTLPLDLKVQHAPGGGNERKLLFKSHDGELIHAKITLPDGYDANKRYPLYLGDPTLPGAEYLTQNEFISVDISLRLQGAGSHQGLSNSDGSTPFATIWARLNAVIDYRRLLDLIDAHYAVDNCKVIVGGRSRMGRIVTILAAIDDRIKAVIAASTSSDWLQTIKTTKHQGFQKTLDQPWFSDDFYRQVMAPIDPQYFAKFIEVPVLILHGTADDIVTIDGAERLDRALGSRATLITYRGADHSLQHPNVVADANRWITQQFFSK